MRSLLALVVGSVGCAVATPARPAPFAPTAHVPPVQAAAEPTCPRGGFLRLVEHHTDGSSRTVGLACARNVRRGDEWRVEGPAILVGETYAYGEGGDERIEISPVQAARLWGEIVVARDVRHWSSCAVRAEDHPVTVRLELDDGDGLHFARCVGPVPAWRSLWSAIDAAIPEPEPFEWPYDGTYWGDELGYYAVSARTRFVGERDEHPR